MGELTALWIRFDLPYARDANLMKVVMGVKRVGGNQTAIETFVEENISDIPKAIDILLNKAVAQKINVRKPFTLVFPLDDRHQLAWIVREHADKHEWEFKRQIPEGEDPSLEYYIPFVSKATGSAEDTLSPEEAEREIVDLNNEAHDDFSSGMDLLDAMGKLRHALQISWQHLGWGNPSTAYTLRNLMYVYGGTGNLDNEREGLWLLRLMIKGWEEQRLTTKDWPTDAVQILRDLEGICARMNDLDLAKKFEKLTQQ